MIHILEGSGILQVDFKNFENWDDKLIFLEKGQYIKFMSDSFLIRKIEFDDEDIFHSKDFRVLFKHLVSLGYINFNECVDCQNYLNSSILSNPSDIIDISSKHWYWQNPFKAENEEYHIIFDVKDLIDDKFKNHLSNYEIVDQLRQYNLNAQAIFTEKIGITIKQLMGSKRLTESQKELAFSEKSVKEIAYEYGYSDPAYFNRVFKKVTGKSPNEFRVNLESQGIDPFIANLRELLQNFHSEEKQVSFYADKLKVSVNTLSKKVQEKLQISIGQLIRQEIINSAKKYLDENKTVKEISYLLNFEESNHFSSFFKHYTGLTPSEYQKIKVQ